MKVVNQVVPSDQTIKDFFGSDEDGPFVMVNLLKFKEKAEYESASEPEISGAEAYARYGAGVGSCLAAVGARDIYSGAVTGLLLGEVEENWDMVALVEYPSVDAMQRMVMSAEYQEVTVHRTAGLAGQLNIRTKQGKLGE